MPSHSPDTYHASSTPATVVVANMARQIAHHISQKNWDHPDLEELIASNMEAYLPHSEMPLVSSRKSYIDNYRAFARKFPGYKCEVVDITATVNNDETAAEVWVLLRVVGCPDSVQRENVTITYWKRSLDRNASWTMFRQTGIRGPNGYW